MTDIIIPKDYNSILSLRETEKAIKDIKDYFQLIFSRKLNLERVTAPRFVLKGFGINDDLSGKERKVSFPVKAYDDKYCEVVFSLAKWKRMALSNYKFNIGEGLYTDMDAIRPDEDYLDNFHSIYVDQWDWEKVITNDNKNIDFLESIVKDIYSVIVDTEDYVFKKYSSIKPFLPKEIYFIYSQDLEDKYPNLSEKEREYEIAKEHKAVFISGIGHNLKSGKPHDLRAPDYDDWSTEIQKGRYGLNGDIIIWNPVLNTAMELSSMGIRVDKESLLRQLDILGCCDRKNYYWHSRLLKGDFPLSIGGGIGQSRLCMYFLRKAHIGEVQSSIWSEDVRKKCKENNIYLL
jgi:aspartate--ammonia ligase